MAATILLVEDDLDIQQLLSEVLEEEGYTAILAANGQVALAMLAATPPDLILLDYMMPLMDGATFVQEARRLNLRDDIPIILMTAASLAQTRANEVGADSYLSKPFEVAQLLQAIERFLP